MSQFQNQQQSRGEYGAQDGPLCVEFDTDESTRIQRLLRQKLGPEHVSTRQGMGGTRLSYIEGWRIISIANEIFGFNGWRSSIQNMAIDFMDMGEGGRLSVGASCVVRITLRDGTYREDVGYGMIENVKSKGQALEKVKKEATTDALKRAMRQFGNVLGNCVYDKEYVKNLVQVQKQTRGRIQESSLYRYTDLEETQRINQPGGAQRPQAIAGQQAPDKQVQQPPMPLSVQRPPNQNQLQAVNVDETARHRRVVGQQAGTGTRSEPSNNIFQQSGGMDEVSDFDMDVLDDEGVLDMIADLETDRPIIHESPSSFGFVKASNPQQQYQQHQHPQQNTPLRSTVGSGDSRQSASVPSASAAAASGHAPGAASDAAGHAAGSASTGNIRQIAGGGMASSAARNLNNSFRAIGNQHQQQQQQQPQAQSTTTSAVNTITDRPRSFAEITPFMSTSQNSSNASSGSNGRSVDSDTGNSTGNKRQLLG
ncbi:DNA repair protein rad52 [Coemansia erecta]|uniref:DNA repair protein rad52 n=1 Tax=Coemansia erecta TaxID=147472 RepID=A0A9W7Y1V4_9FUNG|nr:DNA repair protein rad52 [Coemansia erecta]